MSENSSTLEVNIEQMKDIFFEAMLYGYASDKKVDKHEISALLGYKIIPFNSGDFFVSDAYCVTPLSTASSGFTTIYYEGIPVWTMNYSGSYPKNYIPFLKLALRNAYDSKVFVGGRGPFKYMHPDYPHLIYINHIQEGIDLFDLCSSFTNFAGVEGIFEVGSNEEIGNRLGYHRFSGLSMI